MAEEPDGTQSGDYFITWIDGNGSTHHLNIREINNNRTGMVAIALVDALRGHVKVKNVIWGILKSEQQGGKADV
jgi:hypothetical protein